MSADKRSAGEADIDDAAAVPTKRLKRDKKGVTVTTCQLTG